MKHIFCGINIHYFFGSLLEWFEKYCPVHIPTKRPAPPTDLCLCGKPFTKLCAYNTGDGWYFFWECENYCGEYPSEDMVDWWPFHFGAWANEKHLQKIGIEVV